MPPLIGWIQLFAVFLSLQVPICAFSAEYRSSSALQSCLQRSGVHSVVSTDNAWADVTVGFQKRIQPQPASVAFPQTAIEISRALECARNASVKVSALGAAHSFQGYGFGNPGNLVLNMAAFNTASYNHTTKLLKAGGGSRIGPAMKYLWEEAGRHVPHVRGSHVGVTGSSIGGGFGSTSRFLGTPMDNIVSVEYMLYNGTIVEAGEGSDLLWAAKGAGSSYGIILSMSFRTHVPKYQKGIRFGISIGSLSLDAASEAFMVVQDFATSSACPDELAIRWALAAPPHSIKGFFYGDPENFDEVISPLLESLRRIHEGTAIESSQLDFWDLEVAVVGSGMNQPDGGTLGGRAFYTQSLTTTADRPLTFEQIRTLIRVTSVDFDRPELSKSGYLDLWGGVSRSIKDEDTAYAHGNNLWLMRWDPSAPDAASYPSDGVEYLRGSLKPFEEALTSSGVSLRGFVNYADMELTEGEWSARLYGANYPRLKEIKKAVDPEGMFTSHGQSIPLP